MRHDVRMYEYLVVEMPVVRPKGRDAAWTQRVNEIAQQGWRVASTSAGPLEGFFVTFERPVRDA